MYIKDTLVAFELLKRNTPCDGSPAVVTDENLYLNPAFAP